MSRQIFVNLPVHDLARSQAFFAALGFSVNPQFTNEKGACIVIDDGHIYLMLLREDFFGTFTPKPLVNARQSTEVLLALDCASRAEVDALVAKALAAGGRAPNPPQDHGFMYQHGFEDPDGHLWEVFHMSGTPPSEG